MNIFLHHSLYQWLFYFAICLFGSAVGLLVGHYLDKRSGQNIHSISLGGVFARWIFLGVILFIGFVVVIYLVENDIHSRIFNWVISVLIVIYEVQLIFNRIMKK